MKAEDKIFRERMVKKFENSTCPYCRKIFSKRYIQQHVKSNHLHTSKYNKTCKKCKRTFTNSTSLKYHAVTKCGDKTPLKCFKCTESFPTYNNFLMHCHRVHSKKEIRYKCSKCDKEIRIENMKKHEREVHGEIFIRYMLLEKKFKCFQCGEKFKRKWSLKRHTEMKHRVGKLFICNICGKPFSTKFDLKEHNQKYHDDHSTSAFQCTYCRKTFSTSGNLKRHMKTLCSRE